MKAVKLTLIALMCSAAIAWAGLSPGSAMPDFSLKTPGDATARDYLGISNAPGFKVSDIKSDYLLIEIFSMYCPHCQKSAPQVQAFYTGLRQSKLGRKVKMLGIGAGNSDFEVDYFRKKYKLTMPLFSDADYKIHGQVGDAGTPYFILVRLKSGKAPIVVYEREGAFESVEGFMKTIENKVSGK